MKPTIEPITLKDHNDIIIALFGSYEKYRNSPTFLECGARIQYLKDTKTKVDQSIKEEAAKLKWWNVWGKLLSYIAEKLTYSYFRKEVDELIVAYEKHHALPMLFFVKMTNEKFDKTCRNWKKVLVSSGVKEYKND